MATMVLAMPEFISTVPSTRMRSRACKSFDTPKGEGGEGGCKRGEREEV
jgi:hypothetical protein